MIRHTSNRHISAGNPIANLLVIIVGVLTIGAFIVLGVVAAVALGGVILVMAAVLAIRMWWHGRKMPKQGRTVNKPSHSRRTDSTVIEGEFQVIPAEPDENRPD